MKNLENTLMTILVVGADMVLAYGISQIASISFDRALLLITLATVIGLPYQRHSER